MITENKARKSIPYWNLRLCCGLFEISHRSYLQGPDTYEKLGNPERNGSTNERTLKDWVN